VGHINNQLTQLRKAQQIFVFKTARNLMASLKKLQYFNFVKEDLGVLPTDGVPQDEGSMVSEHSDKGWERLCILYFMIAMTQLNLDRAFDYISLPELKFNLYSEFTCKRDLSYYVILILLCQGDYDTFKA
jgi:hypothetical protein